MGNIIKNILFSTRLMAVLFFAFALAMGIGTFIESEYSTITSKIWVYNAWWFEVILIFFMINFFGNMFRYRLFRRGKWATLLIHLSFVCIIFGAFVTRYISYEGVMPIREGATENTFLSEKTYITSLVDGEINGQPRRRTLKGDYLISPEGISAGNWFTESFPWKKDFNGQEFTIDYKGFIQGAEEGIVPDENGEEYLKIVEAGGGNRHNHFLKAGQTADNLHNILIAFNNPTEGAINIMSDADGNYTIKSPFDGEYMIMAIQKKDSVYKDSVQPFKLRSLYNLAGLQFVIPEPATKGKIGVVETPERLKDQANAIILEVSSNGETEEVRVMGGKGYTNAPIKITVGGLDFWLTYGADKLNLPFGIKLNDFIAERYPGTQEGGGYKSFKSRVTVEDEAAFDYDIYMNHVLDHAGYRFFQAQFDKDEKGTILSVSHDYWGTNITYLGYMLLYLALMVILFDKNTRFGSLKKQMEKIKKQKSKLTVIALLFFSFGAVAQDTGEVVNQAKATQQETVVQKDSISHEGHNHAEGEGHEHEIVTQQITAKQIDSIIYANLVPKEHADKFGRLVIQDGGRMKPANTFAQELVRKLSKSNTYNDNMSANQVLLSMIQYPKLWYNANIISIKSRKHDSLRTIIGIEKSDTHAMLLDFFDEKGNYKLAPYLQDAYKSNTPNQYEKAIKEYDLKLGLINRATSGEILKIFPLPEDENNKWISGEDYRLNPERGFQPKDSLYERYVKNAMPVYVIILNEAQKSGNYKEADNMLDSFRKRQEEFGSEVLPSLRKIDTEILYNKINIFERLMIYYLLIGFVMFVLIITQIFKDGKRIRIGIAVFKWLVVALFVLHTLGLITRWYISGHAPWSDAYESMLYVAFATMLFGILFGRKSDLALSATTFVVSIVLLGAHMNWLDPNIANLVPVLDSYWLLIHVAVIVASYGPFALAMILGIVSLLLIILTTKENKKRMELNLKEITIINEMAITVGLVMLTIGNFLGGMWANESWGRYWGWDPKETWALISIMVYAFILHMRLVPGLRGRWFFNWMSISAFGSILFTYFGVNFVLSGLHSYATGDAVLGLPFVYTATAIWLAYGALAYWRYQVHYQKNKSVN
ncbi:Cytochrome c biogenesis protein CcsA [Kordia antarctica]|uniref:Cytochrome c biogenesis protein CcsA n=1 Tax=Kordia antarctica TaxID=1218801 RepID=A0A7L4ZGV6_9FLAO|nr:cytochrome c biogenesis protein CcsA [Kordia antarctica]QHI35687.1 Cytochrome c biogenesis protein CcsA [Kordia antarctica]